MSASPSGSSSGSGTTSRDETAASSTPGGLAGGAGASAEPSKKFEFLLKQTELFSHFMGETKAKSPLKVKPGKAKGESF